MSIQAIPAEALAQLGQTAPLSPPAPDASTQHWGILAGDRVVAAATIRRQPAPNVDNPHAWELVALLTHPDARGQRLGPRLLRGCIRQIAQQRGTLLWTHSSTDCSGFYEKQGFFLHSENPQALAAEAPRLMWRTITPADRFLELD